MSKNEELLENAFLKNNIMYEKQVRLPILDYPWKTIKSPGNPKCDFFLPKYELYIEVKGFMTIEAMSKMAYLSKQQINYYIFQCTEYEWNPFLEKTNMATENKRPLGNSKSKQLKINIDRQISELCNNDKKYFENISHITEVRLNNFIKLKVDQFIDWNGKWI